MKKRKTFYTIIKRSEIVGVKEQDGFEIKIDGEVFNAYASKETDRTYIIDPKTGLALYIHDNDDITEPPLSESGKVDQAKEELLNNKERLEKWRARKNTETYKLSVQMYEAYKIAEELREKRDEAAQREK